MDVNYWLASKIIYSYSNILFDAEVFDHSQLKSKATFNVKQLGFCMFSLLFFVKRKISLTLHCK